MKDCYYSTLLIYLLMVVMSSINLLRTTTINQCMPHEQNAKKIVERETDTKSEERRKDLGGGKKDES